MKNRGLSISQQCTFEGEVWTIVKFASASKLIIQKKDSEIIKAVHPDEIETNEESDFERQLEQISDEEWKVAQDRFAILQELDESLSTIQEQPIDSQVKEIAEKHKISPRTIYRWKKRYDETKLISSLAPQTSSGGRGKGRIDPRLEKLILSVINDFHFQSLNPKVSKSYRELKNRCNENKITPPSLNTFRSRINLITKTKALEKRLGKSQSKQLTQPVPGNYPDVQSPLEVVQIDHTKLDIIIVDEDGDPIGRPWITVGIDLYSRMVTGLCIAFDSPGVLGTGICISNSILSKDQVCQKYNTESDWPISGLMANIHTDNAPEFKSKAIRMACQEYGINLLYRAKGQTHWGGHIERLLGSFLQEIHLIPGTTFSSPVSRREYDSEKEAVLTLSELEEWLHIYIIDVYHHTTHSSLGMSPIMKYFEGIYGNENSLPSGLGDFNFDTNKLKLDFLPTMERTIQRTGVVIDHLRYYADILSPYIYFARSSNNLYQPKLRQAEKFIFKRDPRDLSCIYFLEPKQNQYFPVFLANKSRPQISLWEHRSALKKVKEKGKMSKVTEEAIFSAFKKMDRIVNDAKTRKNKAKSKNRKTKSAEYHQTRKVEGNKNDVQPDFNNIKPFNHSDSL